MKVLVAIQARTASTRFPNKVMADINGKPMIQHVYERCLEAAKYKTKIFDTTVALLIPTGDSKLIEWATSKSIAFIEGSEDDLVERYDTASKYYNAEAIIRITGDEPLIPPNFIKTAMDILTEKDYVSNCVIRTYYEGWDIQGCSIESWNKFFIFQKTYREHPFRDFEQNETIRDEFEKMGFQWTQIINSNNQNQVHLSVDEPKDIETIKRFICNQEKINRP